MKVYCGLIAAAGAIFVNLHTVRGVEPACDRAYDSRAADHSFVVGATRTCEPTIVSGSANDGHVRQRTEDCGPPSSAGGFAAPTGENCTKVLNTCALAPGEKPLPNTTVIITLSLQPDGSWKVVDHDCAAPVGKAPGVTATDVRDVARKRVPTPAIGVAPPGGATLVNLQTLLWVDTPADRSLGTVTLVGQPVAIEVHVAAVRWSFGDGLTDAASGPGKRYDTSDPCTAVLCPHYYGHVYRRTGAMTVSATVTWSARYRVGAGAWQQVPGEVPGRPASTRLAVREARGVLVPDPAGG